MDKCYSAPELGNAFIRVKPKHKTLLYKYIANIEFKSFRFDFSPNRPLYHLIRIFKIFIFANNEICGSINEENYQLFNVN